MSYATRQDIINTVGLTRLVTLADRDGDGTEDTGVADQACSDASEEIDSYLRMRDLLPLAVIPGILRRKCVDIAVYFLAVGADVLTDEIGKRRDDAVSWLKQIAAGTASLGSTQDQQTEDLAMVQKNCTDVTGGGGGFSGGWPGGMNFP